MWRSVEIKDEQFPGLERFLRFVITQNADLHKAITLESEESLFHPSETSDFTRSNDDNSSFQELLLGRPRIVDACSKVRFTPLCYDCHDIWFNNMYKDIPTLGMNVPYILLWGNYSARPTRDTDRILVLATISGDSGGSPRMWAISEADSQSLLADNSCGREPIYSEAPGIGKVYFHGLTWQKNARRAIQNLRNRSRAVSFAGAMRHMGKSEKTIHTFYEKEAKRMALEPETTQAGWKEWFWGDDITLTQQTHEDAAELPVS